MFTICKEIQIDCAHYIPDHKKCGDIHGHTYTISIVIKGETLSPEGMLVDFGVLETIIKEYDHRLLNECGWLDGVIPTAENIAKVFWEEIQEYCSSLPHLPQCSSVTVWETPTSFAVYTPE